MVTLAIASALLTLQGSAGTQLVMPRGKPQTPRLTLQTTSRLPRIGSLGRSQVRQLVVDNKLGSDVEGAFSFSANNLSVPGKGMMTLFDAGCVSPYQNLIEMNVRQMGSTGVMLALEGLQKGAQYLVILNVYHESNGKSPVTAHFYWSGLGQDVSVLPKENHLSFVYTAQGATGGLGVQFSGADLKGEYQMERVILSTVDIQRIK